ncbi:MAG: DNA mismatch repair endonuclease MutL [Bacillota bacterium]
MGRIRLLDPKTISQIAAGEVIERPASVVKELVENAIDAGSRRIRVELEEGGRTLIRVTDDGCGMPPEDAELAFVRHATSKIRTLDDLTGVRTLGFRGEALPSMAAVAMVQMVTREAGTQAATMVRYEGGRLVGTEVAAGPPGTQVTLRNLFYNVPARLKFLRAQDTETGAAVEVVTRAALAHPDVALTVEVDGRVTLQTDGRGDLLSAILAAWGRDLAGRLEPISLHDGELTLSGYAGRPEAHRSNRSRQLFFINRRPVHSPAMIRAFEDAYSGLIPAGRRPVGVLFLELPGEAVDVNVHPAKTEVRLAREREAFSFVRAAVAQRLRGGGMIGEVAATGAPAGSQVVRETAEGRSLFGRAGSGAWTPLSPFGPARPDGPGDPRGWLTPTPEGLSAPVQAWPELRPIGQLHQLYLLAEGPDGLYLIDQHAAHERIIFDRLRAVEAGPVQELLVPITVELSAAEGEVYRRHQDALRAAGFMAEAFGPRALLVRGVPAAFGEGCGPQDVRDVLDAIQPAAAAGASSDASSTEAAGPRLDDVRRAVAACRAAVKARNPLFRSEMEALLRDLASTTSPLTCPHGRPTVVKMTLDELNRRFGRTSGGMSR